MQNKGAIRLIAISLALVSLYQLSFTWVAKRVERKADAYAVNLVQNIEDEATLLTERNRYAAQYLDSLKNETVYNFLWLRKYSYKEVKEREINLGLDLRGGMDVTLEVSVEDIIRSLSNHSTDSTFLAAIDLAKKMSPAESFIDRFGKAFEQIAPGSQMAAIFSTVELRDRITFSSSNEDVLKVIKAESESAIANSYNVIRNRIDRFGVSQPNVQRLEGSGRIIVQLPGVKEPDRVRKLLQGTANLEFWETYENDEIFPALQEANSKLKELKDAEAALNKAQTPTEEKEITAKAPVEKVDQDTLELDDFSDLLEGEGEEMETSVEEWAKEYPLFAKLTPATTQQGQLYPGPAVGYAHYRDTALINEYFKLPQIQQLLPRDLKLLWTQKSPKWDAKQEIFELIAIKVTSRDGNPPLDGSAVTEARDDFSPTSGAAEVSMGMNAEGAKIWARLTADNIGKCIAIVLDDNVYSFPRVNQEIKGGRSSITGDFTINEAKDLANVLKSGKLSAPARIIQEEIVGPSLGKEAISSGMRSFIISFIIVLMFMMFYYSIRAGIVADIALLANLFFLFGVLASFQATLTLPGIAGIVLTMGMAVDANVLIFERIREELRAGKGMSLAIADGYKNAYSAIIDGNVTTLLTAVILYLFGSGPVRGFATTLTIGILTSLFSAIFITRLIIEFMQKRNYTLTFSNAVTEGAFRNANLNFVGIRKYSYIVFITAITIIISSLAIRGLNPGVDFAGGRTYVVRFNQEVSTVDVASDLREVLGETPEVKTFGTSNQVKITTKYLIDDNSPNVDSHVDSILHVGLANYLPENTTLEDFTEENKLSSMKVGPTIAYDLRKQSVIAVILALLAIFLYILVRFKNWAYSTSAILALTHDALWVIGIFSLFYNRVPFTLEVDQAFIAAVLTIIGYSINNSVVIFDRVREYQKLYPKRELMTNMNNAINDTLSRTFSTSFSTLIVLVPIFFFGGDSIRGFVFGLIVGIIVGTLSSLFISSPIAYDLQRRGLKKEKVVVKK